MRRPPPWSEFTKYPIVSGTIALAVGVTLAWWSGKVEISSLFASAEIRRGELWRLLTSVLPHANILHLAFNVYWIWVFGTLAEEIFGHAKTFAIFVLLAVASNGAEYAFLDGGVGLSGIGYGLFGMMWMLSKRDRRFDGVIDQSTITMFVVWFFICIASTVAGYPIANVAHGVGAIAGALLGFAISAPPRQRLMTSSALTLLVAMVLVCATFARPWVNLSRHGGEEEARLGYDALMADHNEEALRWFRDATRMQPRIAGDWFDLGIACERLKRHAEATAAFNRAHELEPANEAYEVGALREKGEQ